MIAGSISVLLLIRPSHLYHQFLLNFTDLQLLTVGNNCI